MTLSVLFRIALFVVLLAGPSMAAVLHVDLNSTNPVAPYADWATAATNIQEAIDASAAGDTVFVTNGVYAVGGKVKSSNLTNRIAIDKPITVRSVNGPWVTTIRGNGATNGTAAVRCAWLTNGAMLQGFTLTAGATRVSGATEVSEGGGARCVSSNAVISNCIIVSNTASRAGAIFQGTAYGCLVVGNTVASPGSEPVVFSSRLNNCTVVSNFSAGVGGTTAMTNCIVYYNLQNFGAGTWSVGYTCITPLSFPGPGNFTNAPAFWPGGIWLSENSPCRGTGTNLTAGPDIFGKSWANPPSLGCVEWDPSPVLGSPQIKFTRDPVNVSIIVPSVNGVPPIDYFWFKDGVPLPTGDRFSHPQPSELAIRTLQLEDRGQYHLVASNSFGVTTSAVANVVFFGRYVNIEAANPVPPYLSWETAATNIQDAIDAAGPNDFVFVTNGVYRFGGKVLDTLTNRVVIDKPIVVQSVNGPEATIIQGTWDPITTNGPLAVRCVWMTNDSALSGFTLRWGATREVLNSPAPQNAGGGIWGSSTNAVIRNCVVISNTASRQAGGAFRVTLTDCRVTGNQALGVAFGPSGQTGFGGGAAECQLRNSFITENFASIGDGGGAHGGTLVNCLVFQNQARIFGGGAAQGTMVNCTVVSNISGNLESQIPFRGGGAVYNARLTNCIVYANQSPAATVATNFAGSCIFSYCNTIPLPSGEGNVSSDPQLLADGFHLAESSPCRGAGLASAVSGLDIDGQSWSNAPVIGCDEWSAVPVIGVSLRTEVRAVARELSVNAIVAGKSPFTFYWFKNGNLVADDERHYNSNSGRLVLRPFGPEDASNYQVVASNASGVAFSPILKVNIRCVDAAGVSPTAPYSTWTTAATNIQDAIDAAGAGDIVLVTNGIYNTGGRTAAGQSLTNRVVVEKPLMVASVNGYAETIIEGKKDPASAYGGPTSIRCVWLADGASLTGFTLRNGGTLTSGWQTDTSGGGFCGSSSNAVIYNCKIIGNAAANGGGVALGRVFNSILTHNEALQGGGAYGATLINCLVQRNTCSLSGRAGVHSGIIRNSVVIENYASSPLGALANYGGSPAPNFQYSCTTPLPAGTGNISLSPLFLDTTSYHLPASSPLRGAGSSAFTSGTDNDGESWANPPAIGADEVIDENLAGPLAIQLFLNLPFEDRRFPNQRFHFGAEVVGRPARVDWSFSDGAGVTDTGFSANHFFTNAGTYTVTVTAYNNDHPQGFSTNMLVAVVLPTPPVLPAPTLTNGMFSMTLEAQVGALYTVYYATNLATPIFWHKLITVRTPFSSDQPLVVNDPTAGTNAIRFYRFTAE